MKKKKRKICNGKQKSRSDSFNLKDFLEELKAYDSSASIESLETKDIRKLMRKEKKEKLEELLKEYFDQDPPNKDHSRLLVKRRIKTAEKHDVIDALEENLKRHFEQKNMLDLSNADLSHFSMCGIDVPRDVMIIILSYLHCGIRIFSCLGRVNSSFYLLILSNWNSTIFITSRNVRRISLLVLQSAKHLTIVSQHYYASPFKENDFEYILSKVNLEKIKSISFSQGTVSYGLSIDRKICVDDFKAFLSVLHKKKIAFPSCDALYFDIVEKYVTDVFRRSSLMISFPKSTLSVSFPNVITLYYPFFSGKTLFRNMFGMMKSIRKIYLKNLSTFIELDQFKRICKEPKSLELLHIHLLDRLKTPSHTNNKKLKDFFNEYVDLPNLKSLSIKVEILRNHQTFRYKCDFDFHCLFRSTPNLRELSIRFIPVFHDFYVTGKEYRLLTLEQSVYFPEKLQSLDLFDPPFQVFQKIVQLKLLTSLQLSITKRYYIGEHFDKNGIKLSKESVSMFDLLFDYVFGKDTKIKFFDILEFDPVRKNSAYNKYSTTRMTQFTYRKKMGRVRIYHMLRNAPTKKDEQIFGYILHAFPKYFTMDESSQKKEEEEEEGQHKNNISSLILGHVGVNRGYDWEGLFRVFFPPEIVDPKNISFNDGEYLDGDHRFYLEEVFCENNENEMIFRNRTFTWK